MFDEMGDHTRALLLANLVGCALFGVWLVMEEGTIGVICPLFTFASTFWLYWLLGAILDRWSEGTTWSAIPIVVLAIGQACLLAVGDDMDLGMGLLMFWHLAIGGVVGLLICWYGFLQIRAHFRAEERIANFYEGLGFTETPKDYDAAINAEDAATEAGEDGDDPEAR